MKKFLLMVGIALTSAVCAFAQGNFSQSTPQERADQTTATMQKQITGLSSDQVNQIKTINLANAQKMDSMFQANQGGDRSAMRQQFQAMRSSTDSTLKTVLNDDQFKQWQDYQTKMRSQRQQRSNNGGGGGNGGGGN
jgi:predicted lipoprotein